MSNDLSYAKGPTNNTLISATINDLLKDAYTKYESKPFIISKHQNKSLTYAEVIEEAENLALGLIQIGLQIGDKIGIITTNSLEAFVTNIACFKGGFIVVNLSPALQQREFEYCINKIGIKCVICVDKYRNYSIIDIIKKIVPKMEDSENGILESKIVPSLTAVVIISDIIYKGTFNYEQVKLAGAQEPNDIITTIQNKINYHDISIVLFTSGTTGNPKAVGLTHYQMYNFTNILTIRMGFDKKQNKFCFHLPLFHLFGQAFIFLSLKCGGPLVLPSFYYNAEENLKIISEEGCTFVMGPPTMLADIIRVQKEKRLPLIAEEAITGSASCSDDVLRDLKEVLNIKRTFNVYGSTESLLVSMNIIDNYDTQVLNLIGEITDHLEVKIVDSSDNIVPIGTVGNLCVRGFSVLSNYLSQDGKSNDIDKDGWFKTGDAIYMDVNKKVYISGRLKDIINRGGEKISPAEVEEILKTHPDVLEVGVVGTYHERLGEEVCACLKIKPNSSLTLDEIKNFCKGKLSYYKIPSRIHILESFPKTNLGKLQRSILLEQVTKLEQLKGR